MDSPNSEPNLFTLTGADTQITYSTSSISGAPQFSYQGPQHQCTISGADIGTEPTAIGTLVTVTLAQVPDLQTVTLSLLLPTIHLAGPGAGGSGVVSGSELAGTPDTFATIAILTTHHTSIGGPRLVRGPLETYEVIPLQGTAQSVDF